MSYLQQGELGRSGAPNCVKPGLGRQHYLEEGCGGYIAILPESGMPAVIIVTHRRDKSGVPPLVSYSQDGARLGRPAPVAILGRVPFASALAFPNWEWRSLAHVYLCTRARGAEPDKKAARPTILVRAAAKGRSSGLIKNSGDFHVPETAPDGYTPFPRIS